MAAFLPASIRTGAAPRFSAGDGDGATASSRDGATASSGDGATASSRGVVAVNARPSQAAGEPSSRACSGAFGGSGAGASSETQTRVPSSTPRVSRSSRPVSATYATRGALFVFRSVLALAKSFVTSSARSTTSNRAAPRERLPLLQFTVSAAKLSRTRPSFLTGGGVGGATPNAS